MLGCQCRAETSSGQSHSPPVTPGHTHITHTHRLAHIRKYLIHTHTHAHTSCSMSGFQFCKMKKFCRLVDNGVICLPLLNCTLRNNSDGKFYVMSSLPQLKITIKTEIFTAVIRKQVHWSHLSFLRRKQLSCIYPPATCCTSGR